MAESNDVTVSKEQLAVTGEEMELVGMVTVAVGAAETEAGLENLEVAQVAVAVGVAATAAAASDLTRAADAEFAAGRLQTLSGVVEEAAWDDVSQGAEMMDKGASVRAMAQIASRMTDEALERGLELARMSGEMWTISDVVAMLDMPLLSSVLEERGMRLQEIAVDVLLGFTGARALVGAMSKTATDIEILGEDEVAEGSVRLAVSEAAAQRSRELSRAADRLAERGMDNLVVAAVAGEVARESAAMGVAEIAEGAELMGEGIVTAEVGEALDERANR